MFKFVILLSVLAVSWARPGYIGTPIVSHHIVPAAVSHTSRIDYPSISKPLYASYAVAPLGYADHHYDSHHYGGHYAAPLAVAHAPVGISAYSTSVIGHPPPHHHGYSGIYGGYGGYGLHHY